MVFRLQFQFWSYAQALVLVGAIACSSTAFASKRKAKEYLVSARNYYNSGEYFKAARYAFSAAQEDQDNPGEAYVLVTQGLLRAGLYQSATYFFIKTLFTADSSAKRRVLLYTEEVLKVAGADLMRKFLIQYTNENDYDSRNRNVYLYSLGKQALLSGKTRKALSYLGRVNVSSSFGPYALQLKGTANAILGNERGAIEDFKECADRADSIVGSFQHTRSERGELIKKRLQREATDLKARCVAGIARTFYQNGEFEKADRTYDQVPRDTFVWTDILYEQAWTTFALKDMNRTLGKLVSYKSPLLEFVYNPRVHLLRSQAYVVHCHYADANQAINEFNSWHAVLGRDLKRFLQVNGNNLNAYYLLGKKTVQESLYTNNKLHRVVNRFARGPYFNALVDAEEDIESESRAIQFFSRRQKGVTHDYKKGFPGFLRIVLSWRLRTVKKLGAVFVKNSLLDYYNSLRRDFDSLAFIKLEMLTRAKGRLIFEKLKKTEKRSRGTVTPDRRGDQYLWTFNGEFWGDEIGNYVFGLESDCRS